MQAAQAQKSICHQRSDHVGKPISHIKRGEPEWELNPLEPVRHVQNHVRDAGDGLSETSRGAPLYLSKTLTSHPEAFP